MSDSPINMKEIHAQYGNSHRKEVARSLREEYDLIIPMIRYILKDKIHVAVIQEPGVFESLCGEITDHDPKNSEHFAASAYLRNGHCTTCTGLLSAGLMDELDIRITPNPSGD